MTVAHCGGGVGVGVLACESVGEGDLAEAFAEVFRVQLPDIYEVSFEGADCGVR